MQLLTFICLYIHFLYNSNLTLIELFTCAAFDLYITFYTRLIINNSRNDKKKGKMIKKQNKPNIAQNPKPAAIVIESRRTPAIPTPAWERIGSFH